MTWRVGRRQPRHLYKDEALVAVGVGDSFEAQEVMKEIADTLNRTPKASAKKPPPEPCKCFCGTLTLALGEAVPWFGATHGPKACHLPDPEKKCWCGWTQMEHQTAGGHAPGMSPYDKALPSPPPTSPTGEWTVPDDKEEP
jgi:hypothetical protein